VRIIGVVAYTDAVIQSSRGGREGWIERVDRIGDCAEVTLSLADGSLARSRMEIERADWLELSAGQIVSLVPRSAGDPGVEVVGQGIDVDGQLVGCHISQADGLQDTPHIGAQRDPNPLQWFGAP
jgi:hypothetical protein